MSEEIMMIDVRNLVFTSQPIKDASKKDKNKLRESIEELGLLYPLVVRSGAKGKYEVLDGRTRLEVLKDLDYRAVKCIVRRDEAVKDAVVPYDVELYRRHLTGDEIRRFEEVRRKKKEEMEKSYLSAMLHRLPVKARKKAEKFLAHIPDESKKRCVDFLTTLAGNDLENFLKMHTLKETLSRIEKEKENLEAYIEVIEEKKEKEIEKRVNALQVEVEGRLEKIKARGFVLPKDEEEKTRFLKEVEESVREEMREEIKESNENVEKIQKQYRDLNKELDEKKEEIAQLKQEKMDLKDTVGKSEDLIAAYTELLSKATDIGKVIKKIEGVCGEILTLNELLVEMQFRLKEIGEGKKAHLLTALSDIKKALGETEAIIKDID